MASKFLKKVLRKGFRDKPNGKLPAGIKHNPIFRYPKDQKCFCGKTKKLFEFCCYKKMPRFITDSEAAGIDVALKEVGI